MANLVTVFLFLGVIAYGLLAGADFGAGFWDLLAGGARRGRAPRALIDASLAPVWEANHTWLIYCLVILWSGFPTAFAALTTTCYIPLGVAALGIVLRGAGFAFRKVSLRTPEQRLYGAAFAASSVLTPFCFGSVAGALASGRVPAGGGGNALTSWLNPSGVLGGVLAVLVCAHLAAVYLTVTARRRGDGDLFRYFCVRGLASGVLAGAVSAGGIFVLRADVPRLFHNLTHRSLPLVLLAALGGLAGLVLLRAEEVRGLREAAAAAVALVLGGWGVSQYPYLLGTHVSLQDAASPDATLGVLVGVACVAGVLILPSLILLFRVVGRPGVDGRPPRRRS
ncbi:cytochrome d ubiquinol oxidase subunit II [Streptomyces sp. S.PB5]|uniref:cytochrome d ubiquinol oxidase subunit II n=1 Tax=Streptomyces sp. S.PB5 TaxID=3020844 RepID=UPI0025AEF5A7|nr:cytochrome d ubiquinol oxidase subunit II [Streptomyces sp. S.PB5]MDN3027046.1 cytochrome d ubiquinol oxidase subunit II [Streptomyces sp. S.PB5]